MPGNGPVWPKINARARVSASPGPRRFVWVLYSGLKKPVKRDKWVPMTDAFWKPTGAVRSNSRCASAAWSELAADGSVTVSLQQRFILLMFDGNRM